MTAGASALLVLIGGGTAGLAAATDDEPVVTEVGPAAVAAMPGAAVPQPPAGGPVSGPVSGPLGSAAEAVPERRAPDVTVPDRRASDAADRTATRAPRATTSRAPRTAGVAVPVAPVDPAAPVVTTRTVVEKRAVPYRTRLVRDPGLPRGSKRLEAPGVPGEETLRYLVTFTDGRETDRRLVATELTREPQDRVVAFGTRRGKDEPRDCWPEEDRCRPTKRSVACPGELDPEIREHGSVALLDDDLALLDPDDLDGLEMDPAVLC
jgi:hypothetical protein